MSQTKTFMCDQCGKAVVASEMPPSWRQVSLQSIDADNVGSYDGDMCSPECAAKWSAARFEHDLKL